MDEWIRWDKNIWITEYAKESLINDFINYCEEIKKLLKCINYDEECKRNLEHFIYVTKSKSSIDELIATLSIFLSIDSKSLNSILPTSIVKILLLVYNILHIIFLQTFKLYRITL